MTAPTPAALDSLADKIRTLKDSLAEERAINSRAIAELRASALASDTARASAEAEIARLREVIRRQSRTAEMQANIMRDRQRIGRGPPAHYELCERVANAFSRAADTARAALEKTDAK